MLLAGWPCFCFRAIELTVGLTAGQPCFYFGVVSLTIGLVAGLMVGLAINGVVSIASEIAVGLSR